MVCSVTQNSDFIKRSLRSNYHTASRQASKCTIIYAQTKSSTAFREVTNVEQHNVQIVSTELTSKSGMKCGKCGQKCIYAPDQYIFADTFCNEFL